MTTGVAEFQKISTVYHCVEDSVKPKTTTLNLTPRSRAVIEKIREETGVPQTTALERFLDWLADQDPRLRLAILNRDRQTQLELTREAMLKMADLDGVKTIEVTAEITPEQATRMIRLLADRLDAHTRAYKASMTAARPNKK